MKRYALIFVILTCAFIKNSVAQKLAFSYDASGNQTERKWVCINCPIPPQMSTANETRTNTLENNLNTNELTTARGIKVAPNPLKENLNVYWSAPEKVYLKSIEVFNITGQRLYNIQYGPNDKQAEFSFQHLPPGIYLLLGRYSDSKTETVKLIKI